MKSVLNIVYFVQSRVFQILWILVVLYAFCDTFIYYKEAPQYYHLKNMLGLGLYISRGTASVLNISSALILLPLCKKLNKVLYMVLSQLWPALFFFWLEKAKSFHMTVAVTLIIFSVIHSFSHFANLWNFSRHYNVEVKAVNFASYKDESPLRLVLSQPGVTGVSMLAITALMAVTSSRRVRRTCYNVFWYTHRLYLPFVVLLLIHPLSGALKEEVLTEVSTTNSSQTIHDNMTQPKFAPIKSKTWLWMSLPLCCFIVDLLWRLLSRNRAQVDIVNDWQNIPQTDIQDIMDGLPNRLQDVISARGGNTQY